VPSHSALVDAALAAITLGLLLAPSGAYAEDAEPRPAAAGPLALADQAVARNPGLAALTAQVEALERKVAAARVVMDPVVAAEYSAMPWDSPWPGVTPMSGVQLKLQQTLPHPGKNERRQAAAAARVGVERWELAERRLALRGAVRRAYWQLALTRRLEALTRTHVGLVDQLLAAVEARYQVGRGGQQDLLALQVQRGRLQDRLGDFARDERALVARLNAARHAPAEAPLPTPEPFPADPPKVALPELIARADDWRPALKAARAKAAAHRLDADRLAVEALPDITVWAGWRMRAEAGGDDGTDFLSVGVALPLPLDVTDRWTAERAARLSWAAAEEARRDALLDEVRAGLAAALAHWERGAGKAATYERALIPGARDTLDATVAAFQADRADFASLFQAEVQIIDFDRALLRARFDVATARAAIDTLTGEPR